MRGDDVCRCSVQIARYPTNVLQRCVYINIHILPLNIRRISLQFVLLDVFYFIFFFPLYIIIRYLLYYIVLYVYIILCVRFRVRVYKKKKKIGEKKLTTIYVQSGFLLLQFTRIIYKCIIK